jgi:two-component system chemotaxis sensor kinase CheA
MTSSVDLKEFVDGFIAESEQLVSAANAGLLEIEEANTKRELRPKVVRDVFRALHTIKGLAGMMGVQPIVDVAHAMETVLRTADQAGGKLGPRAVELGIASLRAIAEGVRCVADRKAVPAAPESLLDELARLDVTSATAASHTIATGWDRKLNAAERQQLGGALEAGRKAYAMTFSPSASAYEKGITIGAVRTAVGALGDIVKVAPRGVPPTPETPAGLVFDLLVISDAEPDKLAAAACTTVAQMEVIEAKHEAPVAPAIPLDDEIVPIGRSFIRVELARLDDLQDQLSALVVTRFRLERKLAEMAANGQDVRAIGEIIDVQRRQLRDLRSAILRARMVRVAEVLEPLTMLLRSLVRPGIKEARLEIDVRDTELDKAVADRLMPALIHLVRNAVDHAIEPVVERSRLGKPNAGRVTIHCRESGNLLELTVRDDGRGIDRAAIEKKLGHAVADDDALLEAITTPGFSTREQASETSGRGLGMDIVRRIVVNDLGGELDMTTEAGVGTTFTLRVPLTIAIIDVFSFECGKQPFVVPVAAIEEIFDLADHVRTEGPTRARGGLRMSLLERRGKPLPVVALGDMLDLDGHDAKKALVVKRNGEPFAFAVDRVLGRHEVVVRPIEDELGRAPGIAGATDLGDGKPTLLLDLIELGGRVASYRRPS